VKKLEVIKEEKLEESCAEELINAELKF